MKQILYVIFIPLLFSKTSMFASHKTISILAMPSSTVDILLVDPSGRKTGYDIENSTKVKEIPESVYYLDGLCNINTGKMVEEWKRTFVEGNVLEGEYVLYVTGRETGIYRLGIRATPTGGKIFRGIIKKGDIHKILIEYSIPLNYSLINKQIDLTIIKIQTQIYLDKYGKKNRKRIKKQLSELLNHGSVKPESDRIKSFINVLEQTKEYLERKGRKKPSHPYSGRRRTKEEKKRGAQWSKYNEWYNQVILPLDILIKDTKTLLENHSYKKEAK